ncbi:MAG: hypothetical protein KIH01_06040 [Candidatus Freyarchaeota archaeon]|nr:hypothetical protein [Candidatus Jordarchaeia archaeon]
MSSSRGGEKTKTDDLWGLRLGRLWANRGWKRREREGRCGVHWPEDHTFIEVVDPETGERVDEDEKGEPVFTALTRTGTRPPLPFKRLPTHNSWQM